MLLESKLYGIPPRYVGGIGTFVILDNIEYNSVASCRIFVHLLAALLYHILYGIK